MSLPSKVNQFVGEHMYLVDFYGKPGVLRLPQIQVQSRLQWPFYQAQDFRIISANQYDQADSDLKIKLHWDYLFNNETSEPVLRVLMALSNAGGFWLQRHVQTHFHQEGHTWRAIILGEGDVEP